MMNAELRDVIANEFADCLVQHDIRLVCFDFDETITVNGKRFISKTFQRLTHALRNRNIDIAITTFNMGFDIKSLLLRKNVPIEDLPFPVIRRADREDFDFGKFWHITQAMKVFHIKLPQQVLLIDDLANNVIWARKSGVSALEVQRRKGLSSDDLLRCMANTRFYFPATSSAPNLGYIPSASSIPPTEKKKQFFLHKGVERSDVKNIILSPTVVNLFPKKDCSGGTYLLAMGWDETIHKPYFPFLVVPTRLSKFVQSLEQSGHSS